MAEKPHLGAIVGIGAVLPGADDVGAFRASAESAANAIRPPTSGARFKPEAYPELAAAGFVTDGWAFDWRRFHIPPADVRVGNPLSFAALAAGAEALATVRNLPRESTAIVLGASTLGYQRDSGLRIHLDEMTAALRNAAARAGDVSLAMVPSIDSAASALTARLAPSSSDNVVGSLASVAAARIAMHFDLYGPHYAVDAGFASAHAALETALLGLAQGEWDCVVTGGVSELLTPLVQRAHAARGVLAPEPRVRAWTDLRDGTVLGEGVVLFALKRLEDALRDGDTIHAVVRGASTAWGPCARDAMRTALHDAFAHAGCELDAMGHLECAACGVAEIDDAELEALEAALNGRSRPLTLGTSVPEIGHLGAAAGAVAILRAVLSLRDETVFPRPSAGEPQALLGRLPFARIAKRATRWEHGTLAGASALSLLGLAGHVVLERFEAKSALTARPAPAHARASQIDAEPLAIVGLGALFADAPDAAALHANLVLGRDSVIEVPSSRWSLERYCSENADVSERSYGRKGSFVEGLEAASDGLDRTNLLALQAALQAARDAGEAVRSVDPARIATFVAYMPFVAKKWEADTVVIFDELAHELKHELLARGSSANVGSLVDDARREIARSRTPLTPESLESWLASTTAVRVARALGASGPCIGIESACASTFAAFHAAALALRDGRCDLAVAGGAFGDLAPEFFVGTSRFRGLSPGGIAPFDASANGFVPGEGAGMFVLERLSDARRAGHRIRAVLRGIGGSSDGRGRSVLTPSVDGEALAIRRALERASLEPLEVSYVECHGTGTVLGDAAEAMALGCAYSTPAREGPLPIGSVKSNLGHLCAAAGAPAIAKIVLALEHESIPPMIHHERPSPRIDFAACGIEPLVVARPWPKLADGRARIAGASAFGIGGSNFHVLVGEPVRESSEKRGQRASTVPPSAGPSWPELFAVAANTPAEALAELERIDRSFSSNPDVGFVAAESRRAATAMAARGARARIAFTARSAADVSSKIARIRRTAFSPAEARVLAAIGAFSGTGEDETGRVVLLFPGQGPEYAGMALEASARWPLLDAHLERADAIWEEITGRPLRPAIAGTDSHIDEHFEDLHAAVFAVSTGLAALLCAHGVEPDLLVGQSAGELAALTTASVLDFESGLRAMHTRSRAVMDLEGEVGALAIVRSGAGELARLAAGIDGAVYLAADNCPTSCLASGETNALNALLEACDREGIEASLIPGYRAYHSPVISSAQRPYRDGLERLAFAEPRIGVLSTVDLEVYDGSRKRTIDRLVEQYVSPARFREAVLGLHERGARTFLECGPKWPLRTYVEDTLAGRNFTCHASCHPKTGEIELFQRLLGFTFVAGLGSLELSSQTNQTTEIAMANEGTAVSAPIDNDDEKLWSTIHEMVVATLAERTGYPAEMLELDVDLEGDLGIDTVKQAEVYSRARQHFGLPPARNVRMRDYNTLRKVIDHMVGRIRGTVVSIAAPRFEAPPPPQPPLEPVRTTYAPSTPLPSEREPAGERALDDDGESVFARALRDRPRSEIVRRAGMPVADIAKAPFVRPVPHQNGHAFVAEATFTRAQAAVDGASESLVWASAAFVWGALAQAAELSTGRRVSQAIQLADYGPIPFRDDAILTLTLVVERAGVDRVVARALDARARGGDVVTHEATFCFGERRAEGLAPRVVRRLERRGYLNGLAGLQVQAPAVARFGETSAARVWAVELSEMEAVGGVHVDADEAELACCGESLALTVAPPWLEGILEVTTLAFGRKFDGPVVPETVEAVRLGAIPGIAEETLCYVRLRELGADSVSVDVRAVRLSGEPLAAMDGVHLVTLGRAGIARVSSDHDLALRDPIRSYASRQAV
jgi:acyl transferase domain-containing protein